MKKLNMQMESNCELCERIKELTFHHLIPKTLHCNKHFKKMYSHQYMREHGINLCDECHKNIHIFFTEKELGKLYYDKDKLMITDKVKNFLTWVKKQP